MRMFDIENAIKEWRRQMQIAGVNSPTTLDELEAHLRSDFAALVSAGNPERQAFQSALARLGGPQEVCREFAKVTVRPALALGMVALLWVVFAMLQVRAYLWWAPVYPLQAVDVSMLIGNFSLMLAGFFAAGQLLDEWTPRLNPIRERSFQRAIFLSCLVAVISLLLSFSLETICVIQNPWYSKNFPPKFYVRLALKWVLWLGVVGITLEQQFTRIPAHIKILLPLLAGLVAFILTPRWFVFLTDSEAPRGNWIFAMVVIVQSAFLLAASRKMFRKPA